MTQIEPKVQLQGRYSTKEASELLGISRFTLLNHVKKGHIKQGLRRTNNRPFYKGVDILAFWRQCY